MHLLSGFLLCNSTINGEAFQVWWSSTYSMLWWWKYKREILVWYLRKRNKTKELVLHLCKDCGVTLHILCVTGDIRFAKSGGKISEYQLKLLLNNRSSRSFCYNCKCRCPGPFILRDRYYSIFYCSFYCCRVFQTRIGKMLSIIDKVICPPWVLEHNT